MRRSHFPFLVMATALAAWLGGLPGGLPKSLSAKEKTPAVLPNDPTNRIFGLLDTSRDGKLDDFFLLADVYKDAGHPDDEYQHVLRVEYDKARFFGKFRIIVRSILRPTPEQMKAYTPKQLYDFGSDSEKFEKIDPGPFGQKGDLYLRAQDDRPLATAPVTPEVRKAYETYLTRYVIPALEKK